MGLFLKYVVKMFRETLLFLPVDRTGKKKLLPINYLMELIEV